MIVTQRVDTWRVSHVFISSLPRKGKLKLFLHITDADFLRGYYTISGRKFRACTFRSLRVKSMIPDNMQCSNIHIFKSLKNSIKLCTQRQLIRFFSDRRKSTSRLIRDSCYFPFSYTNISTHIYAEKMQIKLKRIPLFAFATSSNPP